MADKMIQGIIFFSPGYMKNAKNTMILQTTII